MSRFTAVAEEVAEQIVEQRRRSNGRMDRRVRNKGSMIYGRIPRVDSTSRGRAFVFSFVFRMRAPERGMYAHMSGENWMGRDASRG